MNSNGHTINEHFENRAPEVKATYAAILNAAKKLGPVKEEAKKTSIHLIRKSAFAGRSHSQDRVDSHTQVGFRRGQ